MRILVTRPQPDADKQAKQLVALGYEAIVSPMLEVQACNLEPFDLTSSWGVVATSRNALRTIADHPNLSDLRPLPLYVVGKTTAETAQNLGFENIITGPSDAAGLADLIIRHSTRPKPSQNLLYLAASEPAYDLTAALEAKQFSVDEKVVYRTIAAENFSEAARVAISDGKIDAVLLMSQRTATVFLELLGQNGLEKPGRDISYLCISNSVAKILQPFNPPVIEIADHPDGEEMLALVHRMTAKSQ